MSTTAAVRILILGAVFTVTVAVITFPVILYPSSRLLGSEEPINEDTVFPIWCHWYLSEQIPVVLTRPSSLRTTELFYYPWGTDLYLSNPCYYTDAIPSPVTATAGFPADVNFHLFVVIIGNACAAYLAGRWLGAGMTASALGGALFTTIPYFSQAIIDGRPEQSNAWFVLLGMCLGLQVLYRGGKRRICAAAAVFCLAGIFYWFHAVFLLLFMAGCLIFTVFRASAGLRTVPVKRATAVTILFFALITPFVYPFINETISKGRYHGIKLDKLVPLSLQPAPGADEFSGETTLKSPGALEALGGAPAILVLALAAAVLIRCSNRRRTLFWMGTAVCFYLLSLGPVLQVRNLSVPLPFSLLHAFVPFFSRIMDTNRLGVMMHAACVLALISGLAALSREHAFKTRTTAVFCLLVWFASVALSLTTRVHRVIPAPRQPSSIRQLADLPPGAVIDVPLLSNQVASQGVWYQISHRRPMLTGPGVTLGFLRPGEFEQLRKENSLLVFLTTFHKTGSAGAADVSQEDRDRLTELGFRYVIHHRKESATARTSTSRTTALFKTSMKLRKLFGTPVARDEEVEIFDLAGTGQEQ